jgi:hypothetical protein
VKFVLLFMLVFFNKGEYNEIDALDDFKSKEECAQHFQDITQAAHIQAKILDTIVHVNGVCVPMLKLTKVS